MVFIRLFYTYFICIGGLLHKTQFLKISLYFYLYICVQLCKQRQQCGPLAGEKRTRGDGCELPERMLGTNLGPLGKQHLLLTAKPSLSPDLLYF